jgi:amino acid adenylation domain-containing protein
MVSRSDVEDAYVLSPMQRGMLFHSVYSPESDMYFEQMCFEMDAGLDRAAFERAWQSLIERHSVFRTAFAWERLKEPLQIVFRDVRMKVSWDDWRHLDGRDSARLLEDFLERDRKRGFQFTRAPLMRVSVIEMPDHTRRIVWSHHHLLLDGWCLNLVFNELFSSYAAYASHLEPRLAPVQPYRSYIDWLGSRSDVRGASGFWRRYLAGYTAPARLSIDRSAPTAPYELSGYGRVTSALPAGLTEKLTAAARSCRVTTNTAAQVAWALLLSRYTGSEDVLFGATVSGRSSELPGSETMVGMFINTLPVRVRFASASRLSEVMQQVQADQVVARQFESSSLAELRRYMDVDARAPLFESNLAFQNYPALDERYAGTARVLKSGTWRGPTNFALSATIEPGAELVAGIAYYESHFERAAVERLLGHWLQILGSIAEEPGRSVASVSLSTAEEVRHLTVELNRTTWGSAAPPSLAELLDTSMSAHADAIAILEADGSAIRYRELAARIEHLRGVLCRLGVGPEQRVGIHLERGLSAVVAICAVVRAGAAYVPVDVSLPPFRVSTIFEQAQPRVILTQTSLSDRFEGATAPLLILDQPMPCASAGKPAPRPARLEPEHLAYIIYTSGSTGIPKGVAVAHRGIANNLLDLNQRFGLGPGDRMLAVSSLSFDMSVYEILGALVAGATIVLPTAADARDPAHWMDLVERHAVTVWNSAPPLLDVLVEHALAASGGALASIRLVILGGDWVPLDLPRRLRMLSPAARFVSLGGATEASIHSTSIEVGDVEACWRSIPYGTPLANQTTYILDTELRAVPIGIAGELYLGGIGLGRGYDRAPSRTAERFLPNPYASTPGERIYRTGDLARYGRDGVIELLGRLDNQTKIRGNRVEPDEVAAVLVRHAQVRQAIVRVLSDPKGEAALVAYVIARDVSDGELIAHVRAQLPSYMAPSAIVRLASLPLSSNGKIDRGALPSPAWRAPQERVARRPVTATESELAAAWSELTGEQVDDADAHFFEVGGDSLRALRLASVVRSRLGVELPVRTVFEYPVLRDLGQRIDVLRSAASSAAGGLS